MIHEQVSQIFSSQMMTLRDNIPEAYLTIEFALFVPGLPDAIAPYDQDIPHVHMNGTFLLEVGIFRPAKRKASRGCSSR